VKRGRCREYAYALPRGSFIKMLNVRKREGGWEGEGDSESPRQRIMLRSRVSRSRIPPREITGAFRYVELRQFARFLSPPSLSLSLSVSVSLSPSLLISSPYSRYPGRS